MLRHHQVLEHRHTLEQPYVLESASNACSGVDIVVVQALKTEAQSVGMGEGEHPLGWFVEARDAVEDCGLAGAVRSDQCSEVAAACLEGYIIDRHQAAEALSEMLDLEDRVLLPPPHARRSFTGC